ncbi:hypothetical protein FHT79_006094 [Rhizobium sp. BK212]|uniref:DUF4956 domain-containing protein n=1 Tax=Rhizobium sp. BK212 TaxID=2587074 RepID=UPI00161120A5|nr:DUF4956 domain-containing protein [Rhizobium sp. BK212]MBB4218872.1 hypothetical protein [Rhizobium sp. BK212]
MTEGIWVCRIVASLLAGIIVGRSYALLNRANAYSTSFVHSCVLTSFLCAILAGVIADEAYKAGQALAFALVGMLGLIRFRTVVKDTREFTMVFLAIVTGLAIGADHIVLGLIGCGISVAMLFALDRYQFGESSFGIVRLKIKLKPEKALDLAHVLQVPVDALEKTAAKLSDDGSVSATYEGMLPKTWSASEAIAMLRAHDAVEEVAIARQNRFRGRFEKDDD